MTWTIVPAPVGGRAAVAAFRAYLADIVSRYHGRPATADEVDEAAAEAPGDTLAPPHGVFLLARDSEGRVVGCAGVRMLDVEIAELTRLWTAPGARGRGLGRALVAEAERAAAALGASAVRLDTREDLTEARRLYARCGYAEIAPYHDGPYADRFFEKRLDGV